MQTLTDAIVNAVVSNGRSMRGPALATGRPQPQLAQVGGTAITNLSPGADYPWQQNLPITQHLSSIIH